jgi:cell division septum initiation protein DivIVA
MRKKMIVRETTERKSTAGERRVWAKAEREAERERESYAKNKALIARHERCKATWAQRIVEVEAALALVGDPDLRADMQATWNASKAQVEAQMVKAERAMGILLGKAERAPTPGDRAADLRLKNLGMTPHGVVAVQGEEPPTAEEREAARRRVQSNLGLGPRS